MIISSSPRIGGISDAICDSFANRSYISSFDSVKNRGEVLVSGISGVGEVPQLKLQEAYNLGISL